MAKNSVDSSRKDPSFVEGGSLVRGYLREWFSAFIYPMPEQNLRKTDLTYGYFN
jgi:hypothetical protein